VGGLTANGHDLALRRLKETGVQLPSWIQVLLEFQGDWTRHETYEAARAIVVANGGGIRHETRSPIPLLPPVIRIFLFASLAIVVTPFGL
jgi:hypothetical protein